jgi:hypothetical protein
VHADRNGIRNIPNKRNRPLGEAISSAAGMAETASERLRHWVWAPKAAAVTTAVTTAPSTLARAPGNKAAITRPIATTPAATARSLSPNRYRLHQEPTRYPILANAGHRGYPRPFSDNIDPQARDVPWAIYRLDVTVRSSDATHPHIGMIGSSTLGCLVTGRSPLSGLPAWMRER